MYTGKEGGGDIQNPLAILLALWEVYATIGCSRMMMVSMEEMITLSWIRRPFLALRSREQHEILERQDENFELDHHQSSLWRPPQRIHIKTPTSLPPFLTLKLLVSTSEGRGILSGSVGGLSEGRQGS
jgi:hypothetical protein